MLKVQPKLFCVLTHRTNYGGKNEMNAIRDRTEWFEVSVLGIKKLLQTSQEEMLLAWLTGAEIVIHRKM